MEPTRSISSQLMGELIKWRNANGAEDQWKQCELYQSFPGVLSLVHGQRRVLPIIAAEVGLVCLSVAALVESAVYNCLFFIVRPFDAHQSLKFDVLAQSSSFTFFWALADCLYNVNSPNILSDESLARMWSRHIRSFVRPIDRVHAYQWVQQNGYNQAHYPTFLNPIVAMSARTEQQIEACERFLEDGILDDEIRQILSQKDCAQHLDAMLFVATKAIWTYTIGPKHDEPIPEWLNEAIREQIEELRNLISVRAVDRALEQFSSFLEDPESDRAKYVLSRHKEVGTEELFRGGFLAKALSQFL